MAPAPKTVTKSRSKTQSLEHCREVETSGKELVITDHPCEQNAAALLSYFRGTVLQYDDPTAPVGVEDWDALR